ncbi:DEAD/DEAH box helicase [Bdellovibrio bacteriovorus]|uniref:DEAD/DEAH box helicase n=1 Tax=Bdellovibrio bacteriovorus TaxID=959 RepID=UPI0035A58C31
MIEKLLKNTLELFASKVGLTQVPPKLTLEEIAQLLNEADSLSMVEGDRLAHSKAISLCGLISEIVPPEAEGAAAYISRILLRVGLAPTAKMVQSQLKYCFDEEKNSSYYLNDLGSYVDNAIAAVGVASNQVSVNGYILNLTEFQKRIWDAVDLNSHVGISAPTSAGKSFVICSKIVANFVGKSGSVIFIVPTISLVNQVSRDISRMTKQYGISGVRVFKSFSKSTVARDQTQSRNVFVVTQERASAFFQEKSLDRVLRPLTVIVDEVQNIEQSGSDSNERSMLLLEVIRKFIEEVKPDRFIVSGPRIANLEAVLSSWVEDGQGRCESEKVPTVVNVSYAFNGKSKDRKNIVISQYVEGFKTVTMEVADKFQLRSQVLMRTKYNESTYNFLGHLVSSLESDGGSLIFAKSSTQAFKTASEISRQALDVSDHNSSLIAYAKETVHPMYGLASCLERGVAYHHGKVPTHIRNAVESAFSSGLVKRLVCTTTLMQGVNLPAKNIIVRNPDLTSTRKLSGYEFTNLRGRAGRLMKDFVGRAIMVDEESFSDEEISLEISTVKELDYTYRSKFESFRNEILDIVDGSTELVAAEGASAELAIYIKHLAYRSSTQEAERRLAKHGIFLSGSQLRKIKDELTSLTVPREVVLSNPFWDPHDLQLLFEMATSGAVKKITRNPLGTLKKDIEAAASFMNLHFPYYAKKYFDVSDSGRLGSICSFAANWARGASLRDIIEPSNWPIRTAKDVEDRIATIAGSIPFGLTKLLKPLVECQDSENKILTYLEAGCYRGEHRALLSLGLSREVILRALPESELFATDVKDEDLDIQDVLAKLWVRSKSTDLSDWDRIQIDDSVGIADV